MTFENFQLKYIDVKIDYDKAYGPQCVDLFRQYAKDVGEISERLESCGTSGGAKDLYLDYDKMEKEKKYFKKLSPKKTPKSGDVAVWNSTSKNKYGHVAIVVQNYPNSIVVFEQNGYMQDGAKYNIRSKENLLGYLRLR